MENGTLTAFRLITAMLLPVVLAAGLYQLERKTRLGKAKNWVRQVLTGLLFGGVAVLATEFGIPVDGATLNVRNTAILTAGLIFGGPAGIMAGVIGAVHRWFATYWGAGAFSQVACTIACVVAGFCGALCRRFMFDNKKTSWFYGLAIGLVVEVLHMLLVFITNMNDIYTAYRIVVKCAPLMILCNGVSVMLSLLCVTLIGKEKVRVTKHTRQISQMFQLMLLICVAVAFAVTCLFTGSLQTRLSYADTDTLLQLNLEDVRRDVREASDENLLKITRAVAGRVSLSTTRAQLQRLAEQYNVAGINLIDTDGIIRCSTLEAFDGFDMASGAQSAEFLCLLDGQESYVQSYQPLSGDSSISRKYAGVALSGGGFVQVGYDAEQFQQALFEQVRLSVRNRHIGQSGYVVVCDEELNLISGSEEQDIEADLLGIKAEGLIAGQNVRFTATVGGVESYCMYTVTEGFYLIACIPVSEAMFSRDISIWILMFMEVIVFAALFAHVYFLIKRLIVDNIHKINGSLAQITDGNLNVHVDVRENAEFASLSDDINATVDTLKRYIAEAESRIDRELEFARQIQRSSLPSVFPPYPDRTDFAIYASMDAAKEVGGDFYDFYLTDPKHLMFLVADVSGKGIPGALFMMRAKTLLKNLSESGRSIDEVFTEANRALCENNDAEMFVTAWMGLLDLESGLLQYVNAGHNPPLVRKNGQFTYLRTRPNFILAGMDMTKYKRHELQLEPGDEIFVYTDGVTEAADPDDHLYGEERLLRVLNGAPQEPQTLCREVRADIDHHANGAEQSDDITMLCVRFCGEPGESICVKPDQASIGTVIDFLAERLAKWQIAPALANKMQLAVDELYSNIVFYSGAGEAKLTVTRLPGALTLRFEDDGRPYDPTQAKTPDLTLSADERPIGGLGVFLIKKLSSGLDYRYVDGRNILTVTFRTEA